MNKKMKLNLQVFASTGVYPTFELIFKVGSKGLLSIAPSDMIVVKDMESFTIAIDGKVEEWTPMDTAGWARRLMTGKSFTISMKGKRNLGDEGNDYIAGLAWTSGQTCTTKFDITFPDSAKLTFDCVINVKTPAGGDSTSVSTLEFDVLSDGKPTYTDAP